MSSSIVRPLQPPPPKYLVASLSPCHMTVRVGSHDIGGHRSQICPGPNAVGPCYKDFGHDEAAYDPELYLRWLQWGAHAPIMRTHPLPDPNVERRAWGYGLPISGYMRDAFARRARLVPALYTANHAFETSSVAALHPLCETQTAPIIALLCSLHRLTLRPAAVQTTITLSSPARTSTPTPTSSATASWSPPSRRRRTMSPS